MRVLELKQELEDRLLKMTMQPLNWEDGFEGCPDTSALSIDKTRKFLYLVFERLPDFSRPGVFPDEYGGIGIQWHIDYDCLMVDVDANGELKNVWWSNHGNEDSTFRIEMRKIMKEIFR